MIVLDEKIQLNSSERTAVTLGKFDGLHLGHQKLIREVIRAREEGLSSVVFTFQRPPKELVLKASSQVLLTNREKRLHLERMGVDYMVEYPFNDQVLRMEPEEFLEKVLVKGLHVKKIVTGPDFRFGYQRRGDVEFLKEKASQYDYEVIVLSKAATEDGSVISSSRIREILAEGKIELANKLLGYPYTITGEVVHGNHLGRTFGVPTINQIPEQEKLLPPNGVYTSMVQVDDVWYKAVSNVGYKPTIEGNYPKGVETCLFDFEQDVYGRTLDVVLYHFQRPEQKFNGFEELIEQLQRDTAGSKAFFAAHPEIK